MKQLMFQGNPVLCDGKPVYEFSYNGKLVQAIQVETPHLPTLPPSRKTEEVPPILGGHHRLIQYEPNEGRRHVSRQVTSKREARYSTISGRLFLAINYKGII